MHSYCISPVDSWVRSESNLRFNCPITSVCIISVLQHKDASRSITRPGDFFVGASCHIDIVCGVSKRYLSSTAALSEAVCIATNAAYCIGVDTEIDCDRNSSGAASNCL